MTTDELVKDFIAAIEEGQLSINELKLTFAAYDPRVIVNEIDREVWSIALNYDTRDVRFIEVDGGSGTVLEVRPVVKHEVYVEYRGV